MNNTTTTPEVPQHIADERQYQGEHKLRRMRNFREPTNMEMRSNSIPINGRNTKSQSMRQVLEYLTGPVPLALQVDHESVVGGEQPIDSALIDPAHKTATWIGNGSQSKWAETQRSFGARGFDKNKVNDVVRVMNRAERHGTTVGEQIVFDSEYGEANVDYLKYLQKNRRI